MGDALKEKLGDLKEHVQNRERKDVDAEQIKQHLQEKFGDFDKDALKEKLGDKFAELKEKIANGEVDKEAIAEKIKERRGEGKRRFLRRRLIAKKVGADGDFDVDALKEKLGDLKERVQNRERRHANAEEIKQ